MKQAMINETSDTEDEVAQGTAATGRDMTQLPTTSRLLGEYQTARHTTTQKVGSIFGMNNNAAQFKQFCDQEIEDGQLTDGRVIEAQRLYN